jgi:hypothetical protein
MPKCQIGLWRQMRHRQMRHRQMRQLCCCMKEGVAKGRMTQTQSDAAGLAIDRVAKGVRFG